jgi:hypothetical protein
MVNKKYIMTMMMVQSNDMRTYEDVQAGIDLLWKLSKNRDLPLRAREDAKVSAKTLSWVIASEQDAMKGIVTKR